MNAHRPLAAAAALSITLGVVGVSPATAQAQDLSRIDQGGTVYVEGTGYCTVGYNDPANRRSLLAAHCGRDGARVHIVDNATRTGSGPVGTLHRSAGYDGHLGNDWAAIQWDGGITVAGNGYSGDPWVNPTDIRPGDQVCYYGQTTARVTCGAYAGNTGNTYFVDGPLTQPGDSGGPMWAPGRGFVGVVSSMWATHPGSSSPGSSDYVVGVTPADGPAVSETALLGLFLQNAFLPNSGPTAGPVGDALRAALRQLFGFLATLPIRLPGIIAYR